MKRIKVAGLEGSKISVWFCEDWDEYQVKMSGSPKATYHTSDKKDALQTAQAMRNSQQVAA